MGTFQPLWGLCSRATIFWENSAFFSAFTTSESRYSLIPTNHSPFSFSTMCPSGRSLSPPSPSPSASSSSSSLAAGSAVDSSFRPAFDVLDCDRDGKISRDDLRAFYAGRDASDIDDDLIGTMMTVADTNKDGFVEYDEFERVVLGGGGGKKNGSMNSGTSFLKDMFKVMDKDGDGQLSHRDLKSFMEMAGLAVTDEDIDAMITMAGGNRNGGVTFEGLHGIIMNR